MPNTLISKIAAASLKVGALATDKVNTAQNYKYISADKILERAGDAIAEVGVVLTPGIVSEQTNEVTYTDNYGKTKTRYDTTVIFEMLLSDGESEMTKPWIGKGNDFSAPDKAFYKAITSGHKYFLAKLLNIGVGNEDGEHEAAQDATKTTQKPVDVVFDKPAMQLASTVDAPDFSPLVARFQALGQELYGDQWQHVCRRNVKRVSDGKTEDASELTPEQVQLLVDGMSKLKEQKKVAA